MKKIARIKIGILLFVMSFLMLSQYAFAEKTASQLRDDISNRNKELQRLEKEAEKIRKNLSKTGSQKASLRRELSLINTERKSIENTISQTEKKIELLDFRIESTESKIKEQTRKIIYNSYALESLLRRIHRKEEFSVLEYLFSQVSLSNFLLDRDQYLFFQKPVIETTDKLRKHKRVLALNKETLFSQQEDLEQETEKFNDQKKIVLDQENKKKTVLKETQNKESLYQKNLQKTLQNIKNLDKEIRNYESKLKFILNKKALPGKGSAVFDWPLKKILITQRFGRTTTSGRLYLSGSHSGMDFRAAIGTPIYSVADGVVKGIGDTDKTCPRASFGKWVFIEHSQVGLSTTSGHLSVIKVKEGQKIKKGDLIAYSGNTGRSTGPHLHLTVYATKGVKGERGVRITNRPSAACQGKTYRMPLAPTAAYLDPIEYLPRATQSMFKHPSLAR